jgi:cysteine desulfurase
VSNNCIYLDNNATTCVDSRVLEAMLPFFTENFSNASSSHASGQTAKSAVVNARKQIANLISSSESEIIFTSGATEAINIAIKGVAEEYSNKGQHIITVKT